MEKENGNVLNLSPYKIDSIERALGNLQIPTNLANTSSNANAIASLLNDIKEQNATVISDLGDIKDLLQQLVDK